MTRAKSKRRSPSQRTIRQRALNSLLLTGFALAPLLLLIVWIGAQQLEDRLLRRQLELEVQRLAKAWYEKGERAKGSEPFTAFWPGDPVPSVFAQQRAEAMPWSQAPLAVDAVDGLYESDVANFFFRALPLDGGTLLVFLDGAGQEPLENRELQFLGTVGGALVAAFALAAVVLAYRLDQQFVEPVRRLADATEDWQLGDWRDRDLPGAEREDELGVLARASRRSALRIHDFLEREREFTRNASHELRTPLTVVRGALELLEQQVGEEPSLQAPLARIERATRRMESTVETFLWLAREERSSPDVAVEVASIVEDCLEDLLAASPRRDQFAICLQVEPALALRTHPQVLRVLCDNLIGNALRHGSPGEVAVTLNRQGLEVSNLATAPTAADLPRVDTLHDSPGFGLRIVHQMCVRSAWQLRLRSQVVKDPGLEGSALRRVFARVAFVSPDES